MSTWVSLQSKADANEVKRVNVATLQAAVEIVKAKAEGNEDAAVEALIALANDLAVRENSTFHAKLPLANWSVDIAERFMNEEFKILSEAEAQQIEARKMLLG